MNEDQQLWEKAHQFVGEAHSLCVLGWIKPAQGRPHIKRLREIVNKLSETVRLLETKNRE